jgi:hypothetical protein
LDKGDVITNKNEVFYRRVFRKDKRYIDKNTGKLLSRAFTPRPKDEGMLSVDLKRLTTIEKALNFEPQRFVIGTILNADVISLNMKSIYDPTTKEVEGYDNIAHCLIGEIPEDDESIAGILARKSNKIEID